MLLKSLKLSGFKSFARTISLDFPSQISAIVGPNGSGKSNVVEAIVWALGEQSIKSLRGKRGGDLIFNGSLSVPRMGKAMAVLNFSDKDSGDEVAISRIVYRDGLNEYFINDKPSRLKDVVDFLSKVGTGTLRHHVISQGEADRVLSASLKERREMVEDALGLRILQLKKEEALRKFQRTDENINQISSLRQEIQPHLNFLKKQIDKARETRELKEELKDLSFFYFSKMKIALKDELERILKEREQPQEEYLAVEKEINTTKEVFKKFKQKERQLPEIKKKGVKDFLNFVGGIIDGALVESDVNKIKGILREAKDNIADFLKKETIEIFSISEVAQKNEEMMETERKLFSLEIKLRDLRNSIQLFDSKEEVLKLKQVELGEDLEEFGLFLGEPIKISENGDSVGFNLEKDKKRLERLRIKIEDGVTVSDETFREYEEIKSRDDFLASEILDLEESALSANKLVNYLEKEIELGFEDGLTKINEEFQKFFESMFDGGKATLRREENGLNISVSLPQKKVSSLEMLSGGERTLTSTALLFAMSQVNPPPFLILDETDAALDESNSYKYAKMLRDLSQQTQLILITHNRQIMNVADILYGITMDSSGVSRLLSLKFSGESEDLTAVI